MVRFQYDVFLSHSSSDTPIVQDLDRRLRREGLRPWLDVWKLVPGVDWQPALERALDESATCAVLIGAGGVSPWQGEEMRVAINRRVTGGDGFRLLPVLLPGAPKPDGNSLPPFLASHTWVEFRGSIDDPIAFRRLVCGIRGIPPEPTEDEAAFGGICPYRGLEAFDVEHSPLFFGREDVTATLLDVLRPGPAGAENRFLAVIAASGSGKSSLARAGLMAAIRDGKLEGSQGWLRAIVRPGYEPIEALATGLMRETLPEDRALLYDRLAALKDGPRSLHVATNLILGEPPRAERLVILVDQFEEVFTLCGDDVVRRNYFANLLHAATVPGGRTIVLLTMRADFYGRCASYSELASALSHGHELVGPMSDDELSEAIVRPAQLSGLDPEPGLVELLLSAVRERPGALPLLQFTLEELWKKRESGRLTIAAYRAMGGLDGALRARADAIYSSMDPAQQEQCRRIFLRLVQPGEGTEDTKRRVAVRELQPADQSQADVGRQVLDRLTHKETRLLTAGEGSVELAHEALVRGWPRLGEWIAVDRAGLVTHRRLTEAAHEWESASPEKRSGYLLAGGRLAVASEWARLHGEVLSQLEQSFLQSSLDAEGRRRRDRQKLWRNIAAIAAAAGLLLAGLTFFAFSEKIDADTNKAEAERQTKLAKDQEQRADEARARADEQRKIAESRSEESRKNELLAKDQEKRADAERARAKESEQKAIREATKSRYEADRARALLLGTQSRENFERDPQLGITLAVEAVRILTERRNNVPEVLLPGEALTDAINQIEGRVLFVGVSDMGGSPDGRWLIAAGSDGTIRLCDLKAADPAASSRSLPGRAGGVSRIAFSGDGRWLATTGSDGTIRLCDLKAADPAASSRSLPGHAKSVSRIDFSGDGRWLATAGYDGTLRLCDLKAADPAASSRSLRGHTKSVERVAFSGDGRWLASVGEDKTLRFWPVDLKQLIEVARGDAYRNLSWEEWQRFFPDQPYHKTFADLPAGKGVDEVIWPVE